METPQFIRWTTWENRFNIENCDRPGVYLVGQFHNSPPTDVDPFTQAVVYIGETCDQSLGKRWYQFGRSAFDRKNGHSGGWTFSSRFCNDQISAPPSWLYIAALPVLLEEPHRSAYIRYLERWLIWEYVQRFGRLPICNSK